MNNQYERVLINNASKLDAIISGNGKITQCALELVQNLNSKDAMILCTWIKKASELNDAKVTTVAIALKNSLIMFYGHKELSEICNRESVNPIEEKEKSIDELLFELNSLVGLEKVKSKVNDLICFQKVQLLRRMCGLTSPKSTMHLAFTGNPGTGKTTVARIVGRIYKQIGILSKGHFIEVSRTDLIAGYQGQTALKVKEVIERAKGGVLFIDEAYSITENDHSDSYGRECLTELTKALEDYRNDLVVIVAGYTEPMNKFFESNPGLKSRFNNFIEFDDYDADELMDIFVGICKKENYVISESVKVKIEEKIKNDTVSKESQFANGRYVRNAFEEIIMNHARRVSQIDSPTKLQLQELTIEDLCFFSNFAG